MSRRPHYPDGARIAFYTAIGFNIRSRREAAGLSLRAVAEAIGSSSGTLNGIETEGRACPLHILRAVARLVRCTPNDLIPMGEP